MFWAAAAPAATGGWDDAAPEPLTLTKLTSAFMEQRNNMLGGRLCPLMQGRQPDLARPRRKNYRRASGNGECRTAEPVGIASCAR